MSNESAHNDAVETGVDHLNRAQGNPLFAALWTSEVGVCLVEPGTADASATIVAANAACYQQSGHDEGALTGAVLETFLLTSTPTDDAIVQPPNNDHHAEGTPDVNPHLNPDINNVKNNVKQTGGDEDENPYALDDLDDLDQLALFDEDLFDETVSPRASTTKTPDTKIPEVDAASNKQQDTERTPALTGHNLTALATDPSRQWRVYLRHRQGHLLTARVSVSALTATPLVTLLVRLEPPAANNLHYTRALYHFTQRSHLHDERTADTPQYLLDTLVSSLELTPLQLQHAALYLHHTTALSQANSPASNDDPHEPWTVWTPSTSASPSISPSAAPLGHGHQSSHRQDIPQDILQDIPREINVDTLRQHLSDQPTLQIETQPHGERYYVPLVRVAPHRHNTQPNNTQPSNKHAPTPAVCLGSLVIDLGNVPKLEAERHVLHDVLHTLASQFTQVLEQQQSRHHFEARLAAKTDELDLKAEQLAYLHALIDSTSDFVCLMDASGNLNYVNPAGQQLVGDANGVDDTDLPLSASVFVTLNAKSTLASHFAEALQTGTWRGETNFTHADGRSFPVSQVLTPLYNQRAELAGFGTIARDISEHKALEHALRSSESKMRALLEAIPDLIFVFDKQGRYLDVAGRSDGVSLVAEDLVGYSLFDVLPEDLANRLFAAIHEVLLNGYMQRLEYQIGSGTVSEAQLVKMSEGRVLMVVRDITTRKRTEQDLRVFQSLVEAAADGIVLIDDSGIIRYSNPAYDALVGVTDPRKQHITQMLSRSGKQTFEHAIEAMLQVGAWQGNIEHQHSAGAVLTTQMSSFAIRDDKDNFTQAGAIVRDINREYQAERQLQAYKQLLESLLEHLPAGVCVINYHDDSYLLVNHSFAKQAGYTPADMIGKRQTDVFDAETVSVWHQRNQRIASSRQMISFEEHLRDEQGNMRYYFTSEFPLIDAENEVYAIGVVTSDISNVKHAEHALRQRNDLLTLLHGLSRQLNSATTYSEMLSSVCEMLTHLHMMAGNLFIIELDQNSNPLYSTKMAAWHEDGGVHGQPLGTRLYLPDYPNMQTTLERPDATNIKHLSDLDEATQTRWRKGGVGTLAIVPIAPTGLWLGQVILYWRDEHIFSDSERELLNTLPDILAPVVANRHLLTSLEQTVNERTRELQESQALLQGFMNHTPAVMWVKDLDSTFIMANENLAQMYGVNAANIRGKSDYDIYAPEVAHEFARIEREIATSKQARILEEDIPLKDGMHYWITTKFPILDARGNPQAIGGFSFDITDAKRAERALQDSREQLARAETELNITKRIQELLLPSETELEAIAELDIAGVMQPAEQVGGDYFDVLAHESGVMLSIGDVTDHGLESGLLMLMTQTAVRTLLTAGIHDSHDFFEILNRALFDNLERMQADKSLTLLRLDYYRHDITHDITHDTSHGDANIAPNIRVSGQHEHLIVVAAGGAVSRIDTLELGMPLGLERTVRRYVAEKQVALEPGGGVVLYTDGITEAENAAREQYGLNRLCEVIGQHWTYPPEQLCQIILQDVSEHVDGHTIYDDITLLVAKRQHADSQNSDSPNSDPQNSEQQDAPQAIQSQETSA